MTKNQIHKSLQELHSEITELRESYQDNPQASEMLKNLTHNIQDALENPGEVSFEYDKLLPHLKNSIEYFEVSHPRLTGLVNNIIQSLNSLGI